VVAGTTMASMVSHFMAFLKKVEMTKDVSEQRRMMSLVATRCNNNRGLGRF
jgi:hypothetical protein